MTPSLEADPSSAAPAGGGLGLYDVTVPVFLRAFGVLESLLEKARAHATEQGLDAEALLDARLVEGMGNLAFQVQRASDTAKASIVRLGGAENVRFADEEATIDDLLGRIARTRAFLEAVTPDRVNGREDEILVIPIASRRVSLSRRDYVLQFGLPNFFFHITTAYALLRQRGVDIGKRDFLGPFTAVEEVDAG
jgi:hypothetical protein